MMKKQKENSQEPIALHANASLPNVLIDKIQTVRRGDNLCMMRFFTALPEGAFEQSRIVVPEQLIRNFLDSTCKTFDYYPKPEENSSQE
ncbi:MAG: hypothetical protein D3922_06195 [Candidatus Electrothrix sp. AR1]|nr:hypothetical protein [Candidatus Electrothrix sp. AR1]